MKNFYSHKNVIVFGGGGYIGSLLVDSLKKMNANVSRLSDRKLDQVDGVKDHLVDYSDLEQIKIALESAHVIFYLRSQTSAYKSEENPALDFESNFKAASAVLNAAFLNKNIPNFVMASTVTVYGLTPQNLLVNEQCNPNPTTIYDVHKLVLENLIENYSKRGAIKGAALRLANVFGPGKLSSSNDRGILNQIIKKALKGEEITIFGDGEYLRDYIYVDDVVNAFLHIGASEDLKGEVYNTCTGESRTLKEAVTIVGDVLGLMSDKKIKINFIKEPEYLLPIEKRNFTGDNAKLKKASSWLVSTSFRNGVEKTMRSLKF